MISRTMAALRMPSDVLHLDASPSAAAPDAARAGLAPMEVLILTALEDELSAVVALPGGWRAQADLGGFPYHRGSFPRAAGKPPLAVAAAWLGQMGEVAVGARPARLPPSVPRSLNAPPADASPPETSVRAR